MGTSQCVHDPLCHCFVPAPALAGTAPRLPVLDLHDPLTRLALSAGVSLMVEMALAGGLGDAKMNGR
jgi:hypothetical protein